MMRHFPLVLAAATLTAGCKSRSHNNEKAAPKISHSEDLAKAPSPVRAATVVLFGTEKRNVECSGTLVHPQEQSERDKLYVFTARHCMTTVKDGGGRDAIFRQPSIALNAEKEATWDSVLHLTPKSFAYHASMDIAVIEVEPFDTSKAPGTKPVGASPSSLALSSGDEGIIAGFGNTKDSFSSTAPKDPPLLRWSKMRFKEEEDLALIFTGEKSSTCSGDSGGPIYVEREGVWTLLGVTSESQWPCHARFLSKFIDARKLSAGALKALAGETAEEWTVVTYPATP